MDQTKIAEREYSAAAGRLFAGDDAPLRNPLFGLGSSLIDEFREAELLRKEAEDRWLKDLRQYKGQYEAEEEAKMRGSKAFMRKTRVKVESVDARLMDLLFPANRERNFDIQATPEPSIPEPMRKRIISMLTEANEGQQPDRDTIKRAIKAAADAAAAKMGRRIDDQLAESQYRDVAREVLHSGNLFGTGVLKGPLVNRRQRVSYVWDKKAGKFVQQTRTFTVPFLAHVPLWRWYPDMTVSRLQDGRYAWEHHRLGRAGLAELATIPTFDKAAIRAHILAYPDGHIHQRTYEQELRTMGDQVYVGTQTKTGQYDVFERWGWLDGDKLKACGVDVPEDREHETFFANVWVLPTGEVIKAVLQPIEGVQWPYHLYYYDKDETSIFAEGLAAIMRGDQAMLNAGVRMLLDNAAVTAGPQFEVFVPAFPANADLTSIHPFKVWPRIGGDFQYPAVRQLQFNSHMAELTQIIQLFDTNADEITAIPKFTYGDNPTRGAAGTMGGLSMLLAQANIALKDRVIAYDEGVTKPFIGALYHWNMRFSTDDTIKGDYDVVARGAASLVAKEVRGQALAQFAATAQPEQRMFIKWQQRTQQQADTLDLSNVVMDDEEARAAMNDPAQLQQQQMQQQAQQIALATAQAKLAETQAKAALAEATAMNKRVEALYAAMQAAGVAAQNPSIAPAGDALARSAGWQDATPQEPGSGAEMAEGMPSELDKDISAQEVANESGDTSSPHAGQRAGIETMAMGA